MPDVRALVVPGGTNVGAVALAHAAIHKVLEAHEAHACETDTDTSRPDTRLIALIRDPALVPPSTLRTSATSLAEAFPPDVFPEVAPHVEDPSFWEGIDLVLATSGSTAGRPRLVGLSAAAVLASARANHDSLGGPGKWILALPAHHVGGAMVLARSVVSGYGPYVVDVSEGFTPEKLLPALEGVTSDPEVPGYLSLVPVQLRACLEGPAHVIEAMTRLRAVLVGGSALDPSLLDAARARGITIVRSYGMTETCGGCVHDGKPLRGVSLRVIDMAGAGRLAISGPMLMTRYLDADAPFIHEYGRQWLLTGDLGRINAGGRVEVLGRADDVIISGGLNVAPAPVRNAINSMPTVRDSWVLASPDEKWGQVVTAVVVPEIPSNEVDPDSFGPTVRDHVGSILGRPHAPRRVIFTEELPMLPSGKVDRQAVAQLRDTATEENQWHR